MQKKLIITLAGLLISGLLSFAFIEVFPVVAYGKQERELLAQIEKDAAFIEKVPDICAPELLDDVEISRLRIKTSYSILHQRAFDKSYQWILQTVFLLVSHLALLATLIPISNRVDGKGEEESQ